MSYNPNASFPPRSLPLGVAILAILIGVVGFFYLIGGILLLVLHLTLPGSSALLVGGWVGAIVLAIVGVVLLAVATGLWDRHLWALALTVLVLLFIFLGNLVNHALVSVSTIVVVLLLVYLVLVRHHFD
jgi:hypothetical protein